MPPSRPTAGADGRPDRSVARRGDGRPRPASRERAQRGPDAEPAARSGPACASPPYIWARSRIPTSPCPTRGRSGVSAACRAARRRRRRRSRPASADTRTVTAAGGRPGVADHVGQRLLHDPVRGERDPRRHGTEIALGDEVDRHAGRADLAQSARDVGERRRRLGSVASASPSRRTSIRRASSPCGIAGSPRIASSARAASAGCPLDEVGADAGLDGDDAQRVGDDVVQLLGHPLPIGGGVEIGDLDRGRARSLRRASPGPPGAPGGGGSAARGRTPRPAPTSPVGRIGVEDDDAHHHQRQRPSPTARIASAERQVGGGAVEPDEQRQEADGVAVVGGAEHERAGRRTTATSPQGPPPAARRARGRCRSWRPSRRRRRAGGTPTRRRRSGSSARRSRSPPSGRRPRRPTA